MSDVVAVVGYLYGAVSNAFMWRNIRRRGEMKRDVGVLKRNHRLADESTRFLPPVTEGRAAVAVAQQLDLCGWL